MCRPGAGRDRFGDFVPRWRSVGRQSVAGGSCRRTRPQTPQAPSEERVPPPPARTPSLPGRAPPPATRSAGVYSLRDRSSCAGSCAAALRRSVSATVVCLRVGEPTGALLAPRNNGGRSSASRGADREAAASGRARAGAAGARHPRDRVGRRHRFHARRSGCRADQPPIKRLVLLRLSLSIAVAEDAAPRVFRWRGIVDHVGIDSAGVEAHPRAHRPPRLTQRARQSELREDAAVGEPGDRGDLVALEREDEQSRTVARCRYGGWGGSTPKAGWLLARVGTSRSGAPRRTSRSRRNAPIAAGPWYS